MKKIVFLIIVFVFVSLVIPATHTLYTVDGTKYEGKLVAFKYGLMHFNIYKFNKYRALRKFPLSQVWKIEFNVPKQAGITSSFETESLYTKLRRGKKFRRFILKGETKWLDTGIKIIPGQNILFSISGAVFISKNKQVFQNGELNVKWNKKKQLPIQPTGAVIVKIGEGTPFYIGDNKAPIKSNNKGNLFIGINDFNFKNNSGNFVVKIYY